MTFGEDDFASDLGFGHPADPDTDLELGRRILYVNKKNVKWYSPTYPSVGRFGSTAIAPAKVVFNRIVQNPPYYVARAYLLNIEGKILDSFVATR